MLKEHINNFSYLWKFEPDAVADSGRGGGGGPGFPLICRPKWGLKGRRKKFYETRPPPYLRGSEVVGPAELRKCEHEKKKNGRKQAKVLPPSNFMF